MRASLQVDHLMHNVAQVASQVGVLREHSLLPDTWRSPPDEQALAAMTAMGKPSLAGRAMGKRKAPIGDGYGRGGGGRGGGRGAGGGDGGWSSAADAALGGDNGASAGGSSAKPPPTYAELAARREAELVRRAVLADGEAIDVTGVPITRGPHWKL